MHIVGILNVTPDSFSDGGRWLDPAVALAHAQEMTEAGADIVDVGGESTRPGAVRVGADEEWARIGPVVSSLVEAGIRVSVDTVNASTARAALQAGAQIINDVSGGRLDPDILRVVADSPASYICQHFRGLPADANLDCHYENVVADVIRETLIQIDAAIAAGIPRERIIFDPGLGFALTNRACWQLVDHLEELRECGFPVLIGASRKRFVVERFGRENADQGTAEITARCAQAGMWGVRVHCVPSSVAALSGFRRQG